MKNRDSGGIDRGAVYHVGDAVMLSSVPETKLRGRVIDVEKDGTLHIVMTIAVTPGQVGSWTVSKVEEGDEYEKP